ncbi:MAG: helix-hairpin-helix domain-containing protein, partial [bacterium]
IIKLLKGKNWHDFSVKIEKEIKNASDSLLFERAAELRDSLKALPMLKKEAKTRLGTKTATDYFLFNFTKETGFVTVISKYNNGIKDIYSFNFSSTGNEKIITAAEAAGSFYDTKNFPAAIFAAIEKKDITSRMLSAMDAVDEIKKVKPSTDMINLLEANQNQNIDSFLRDKTAIENQLSLFNSIFSKPINSIQCIDISTLYGELTVAGAIWWEKGFFIKRNYRRFRIKRKGIDDFDSIRETVRRLERKWLDKLWEKPDLLLIDGGIGQVNAVSQLFSIKAPVLYAGISKDRNEVKGHEALVMPDGRQIALTNTPSSLLIKRIRDEAHRFSISWNRRLRKKKSESILSTIPGVGKKREKQLIRYFGSVKNIKSASIEEISSVPTISETLAEIIKNGIK